MGGADGIGSLTGRRHERFATREVRGVLSPALLLEGGEPCGTPMHRRTASTGPGNPTYSAFQHVQIMDHTEKILDRLD